MTFQAPAAHAENATRVWRLAMGDLLCGLVGFGPVTPASPINTLQPKRPAEIDTNLVFSTLADRPLLLTPAGVRDTSAWRALLSVPLRFADGYGPVPLPHALIQTGPYSPMHRAALQHLLDEAQIDPDLRNDANETLLMQACRLGKAPLVQLLLEAGTDPSLIISASDPKTALDVARWNRFGDCIGLIEAHRARASMRSVLNLASHPTRSPA